MSRPDGTSRDPGRQPERTRLSWRRTVLGITVVALLAARLAVHGPLSPTRLLAVAAVLAAWLAVLALGWRRTADVPGGAPGPGHWSVLVTTLVTLGYAGLGVALTVTP